MNQAKDHLPNLNLSQTPSTKLESSQGPSTKLESSQTSSTKLESSQGPSTKLESSQTPSTKLEQANVWLVQRGVSYLHPTVKLDFRFVVMISKFYIEAKLLEIMTLPILRKPLPLALDSHSS